MTIFKRRTIAGVPISAAEDIILNGRKRIDPVICACSAATDQILTDIFVGSVADRRYIQRILVASRDREFPGYRDDINRLRAEHGLPPL
jgi:hypothetical protein